MNTVHHLLRPLIITLSLYAPLLAGCGEDSPSGPAAPAGPMILVLGDGSTEEHIESTLRAAGFAVRGGGLFHEFTGAGLDGVDAVVLLAGVDYNHDMNDQGETALVSFVASGKGLLTTEWLAFSIDRSGFHKILAPILPVRYAGSYAQGSETYSATVDHPVTENLPASFATGSESQYSTVAPKSGATQLMRGNRSGAAVVTWTQGGRVVSWNMAGEYGGEDVWNEHMNRLLVNVVSFVSRR